METNNSLEAGAIGIAIGKKAVYGTPILLSNMVIFNDLSYMIIALLGAFVSTISHRFDIYEMKREAHRKSEEFTVSMFMEFSKAFVLGGIIALLLFLLFNGTGGSLVKHFFGMSVSDLLPSFWFILALAFATESVKIWDGGKAWIFNRFKV
jgi:hypothetical protein